jgi:hypothetical protein
VLLFRSIRVDPLLEAFLTPIARINADSSGDRAM